MINDPISDMLTRILNAQAVSKKTVDVPFSVMKYKICKVLEAENFIEGAVKKGKNPAKIIRITLGYKNGHPAINKIVRVSKSGRRIYNKSKEIRQVKDGYGISILSTPKGVISNKMARREGVGGEVICKLW